MTVPNWWELTLLGLAAFRTWKLIGDDTILDTPRLWAMYRVEQLRGKKGREYAEALIECPWCAGFWLSLAWWGAWEVWPHGTLVASVPLAVSAIVGFLGTLFHALAD